MPGFGLGTVKGPVEVEYLLSDRRGTALRQRAEIGGGLIPPDHLAPSQQRGLGGFRIPILIRLLHGLDGGFNQ